MLAIDGLQTCTASLGAAWTGVAKNILGSSNQLSMDSGNIIPQTFGFKVGTSAGQVDTIINTVRSVAASGTDTITLSSMTGTASPTTINDVVNQACVLARVRAILIQLLKPGDPVAVTDAAPTLASAIKVGAAGSNPWTSILNSTGTILIANGDSWGQITRSSAGLVVASGSNEQLKIANQDGALAAVYRLVILGCSA